MAFFTIPMFKLKHKNLKGVTLGDMQNIILLFVTIGIIGGVGVLINSELRKDMSADLTSQLAINNSSAGIGNLLARLPLIGTIAGFVVLLGFIINMLLPRTG